ncbi:MAG TPA: transposase [bacterium]|nr:transposase [bacterium]
MEKRYSPQLKFQVVKETLTTDQSPAQVARAYDVHPNSIRKWMRTFEEQGAAIFAQQDGTHEYEQRIAELERLVGQKEREIALLKNFLGRRP